MQANEINQILNRPISQELLARDLIRLAYVAKDSTPRNDASSSYSLTVRVDRFQTIGEHLTFR